MEGDNPTWKLYNSQKKVWFCWVCDFQDLDQKVVLDHVIENHKNKIREKLVFFYRYDKDESMKKQQGLVIGMGPSMFKHKHLELLAKSNYDGFVLVCDRALKYCLEAGVTPLKFPKFYVFTIEDLNRVSDYIMPYENADKIKVVYSERTRPGVLEQIKERGYVLEPFLWEYLKVTPNVGLMGFVYGWMQLKLEEIGLIGLDIGFPEQPEPKFPEDSEGFKLFYEKIHNPNYNTDTYLLKSVHSVWKETFYDFLTMCPANLKISNCTEGGCLFGPRIQCTTFREWLNGKL